MKKFLTVTTAALAFAAAGCTTAAMANQQSASADGNGNFEVIVSRHSGDDQTVIIRGVGVEVVDGDIIVNGDAIRVRDDGRIIISGEHGDVLSWVHDDEMTFSDAHHTLRLAEIESDLATELHRLEDMHVIVDDLRVEGLEEAMADLESELGDLENRRVVIVNGERRELTDEERAEIREELEDARWEIRESMEEVRREMEEGQAERREALRVMRIELNNARDELRNAEREAHRVFVRRAGHHADHAAMMDVLREHGASRIRIETENGEDRVWIDGEEVEGDDRVLWLERFDVERLDGGNDTRTWVIETRDDED